MTKAELLAAIAHLPDTAEIWLASESVLNSAECLIRVSSAEIWLGDRAALAEELEESGTLDPTEDDSIIWHNPAALPPPPKPDVVAIALTLAKQQY